MVFGAHLVVFSLDAEADRSFLAEILGLNSVDAGGGWLIFAMPPAEVGVHPADAPRHEMALMCDDLDATMAELHAKGVEFRGEPEMQGWGRAVTMVLPGALDMMLYQPRHPVAGA